MYIDGHYVTVIKDEGRPTKMVLPRGLHKFRVVSEEKQAEGSAEIFILGGGGEQVLRIDIKKIKE